MTDRVHCCVPFCQSTTGKHGPEWICAHHWQLIPLMRRKVYARARRRFAPPKTMVSIWNGLKAEAIERAAGIRYSTYVTIDGTGNSQVRSPTE